MGGGGTSLLGIQVHPFVVCEFMLPSTDKRLATAFQVLPTSCAADDDDGVQVVSCSIAWLGSDLERVRAAMRRHAERILDGAMLGMFDLVLLSNMAKRPVILHVDMGEMALDSMLQDVVRNVFGRDLPAEQAWKFGGDPMGMYPSTLHGFDVAPGISKFIPPSNKSKDGPPSSQGHGPFLKCHGLAPHRGIGRVDQPPPHFPLSSVYILYAHLLIPGRV